MAQFDLKKATIFVKDAYGLIAGPIGMLVNNGGGYITGTTTMAVDGIIGTVNVGDTFTLAGDVTIYTVASHTETLSNTTSITFTPGLVIAATDDEAITVQPHQIELRLVEGTLTYAEKQTRVYVKNRGILDTVRNGDDEPVDVRTDFMWEFIRSQSGKPPTIEETFKKVGAASNWISTDPDQCAPYCVDIELNYNPECTGIYTEQIILPMFRYEELSHDAKQGTIALTGKCNVKQANAVRTVAA